MLELEILELINEGKTLNEITNQLHITRKELYQNIQIIKSNNEIVGKYYYNGNIKLHFEDENNIINNNEVNLITTPLEQELDVVVISDLHLGSTYDRVDLLDKIYDYCVKNGIHIVLNCGDLIDGMFGKSFHSRKHDDIYHQIYYALKNYPFDRNITTFAVLGNHDIDPLFHKNYDLKKKIIRERSDIVPIGYGDGVVNVKNDSILLHHDLVIYDNKLDEENPEYKLILIGHNHISQKKKSLESLSIYIPTLSDIMVTENKNTPRAVRMKLEFHNGYFSVGNFQRLIINKNVEVLSDFTYYFSKSDNTKTIKNEEKPKTYSKSGSSQIDKFNKRLSQKLS